MSDTLSAVVTRFAPSPTGALHLGNAFAALFAHERAQRLGGRFLLRIEDIDITRCRPAFEEMIFADLAWLGLHWEEPVRRQSEHFADYRRALGRLQAQDLTYPCFCTRKQIAAEIAASPSAPHGPDGPLYPGTCRTLPAAERDRQLAANHPFAIRLNVQAALATLGKPVSHLGWYDRGDVWIPAKPHLFGDIVLARKDVPCSYHLAVTVDDALQGVTLVTRGEDLQPATHIHCLLQDLLGLPTPRYEHHRLIRDATGQRLAKRKGDVTLHYHRTHNTDPLTLRRQLGFAA